MHAKKKYHEIVSVLKYILSCERCLFESESNGKKKETLFQFVCVSCNVTVTFGSYLNTRDLGTFN